MVTTDGYAHPTYRPEAVPKLDRAAQQRREEREWRKKSGPVRTRKGRVVDGRIVYDD